MATKTTKTKTTAPNRSTSCLTAFPGRLRGHSRRAGRVPSPARGTTGALWRCAACCTELRGKLPEALGQKRRPLPASYLQRRDPKNDDAPKGARLGGPLAGQDDRGADAGPDLPIQSIGSTTLRAAKGGRGIQPDRTYYLANEPRVHCKESSQPGAGSAAGSGHRGRRYKQFPAENAGFGGDRRAGGLAVRRGRLRFYRLGKAGTSRPCSAAGRFRF